jgi:putative Ca2+/H+ antiporter (TMEM165/GDT1 family)
VNPTAAATAFGLVAVGELPDKTMVATVLLASRGRPLAVWVGAAVAFLTQVALAVTVGATVARALPAEARDLGTAALFLLGALLVWRGGKEAAEAEARGETTATEPWSSASRAALAAFGVVFLAEWGDLTQILAVDLAARTGDPVAVGLGAGLALVLVAGLAVLVGSRLVRRVPARLLRTVTALALLALAGVSVAAAFA